MKPITAWIYSALIILSTSLMANAERLSLPNQKIKPQVSIQFRDANHLHQFLHQNPQAKRFLASNLYRGLFYRLHPVFGLLGSEYSTTWEGRLLDYTYQKTMAGRPLTLAYFPQRSLSSPFGSAVAGLGDVEQKLLDSLLGTFSGGSHRVPLSSTQEQTIQSLQIQGQKFAKGLDKGCLGLSRDPYVAAYLTNSCAEVQADALIQLDMHQLLPAISGVYRRFFANDGNLNFQMTWENSTSSWKPSRMQMPVIKDHQFKKGAIPSGFFSAVPASSVLFLVAQIPDPGDLDRSRSRPIFQNLQMSVNSGRPFRSDSLPFG